VSTPITTTRFVGDTSRCKSRVDIHELIQPEHYRREIDGIFRHAWLPVASLGQIDKPNSYVATDVPPLAVSLLVMRGADNVVRAFYNACTHRGNRLAQPGTSGCKAALTCQFHGWSFATDGKLIGVTDRTQFPDLVQEDCGLVPVRCEVWRDYAFVNFDPAAAPLSEWMGTMWDECDGYFDGKQCIGAFSIRVNSNYNIATNSFSEGYHNAFLHKNTVPDYQGGKGNPMRHRAYLEVMPRHARYSAKANPGHKMTPVEEMVYRYGRKMFPAFPPMSDIGTLPKGVNPGNEEWWAFDVVEIFPCTVLIFGAFWHATMWFWPVDADTTEIRIEYMGYKAKTIGDHLAHAYFRVRNREVFREDVGTMEACHFNLKSGAIREVNLSQQEMLIQNHYRAAADMVAGAGPQPIQVVARSAAGGR
jgi:phenylpropionate dioxygenase-like ring-hydroxylating dioxygenase large terminal subunit